MKKTILALFAVSLLLLSMPASASEPTQEERNISNIKNAMNSTVVVSVPYGELAPGAGFYVAENLILTCEHVVRNGTPEITTKDGQRTMGKVVMTDSSRDLMLIETNVKGTPLKLGAKPKVGSNAFVIGHPLKRNYFVTQGIVSNTELTDWIILDAQVYVGNSGGPVINSAGEVIGIMKAHWLEMDSYSIAVPSNNIQNFLDSYYLYH
jgi:S1-C subfamily serine protease